MDLCSYGHEEICYEDKSCPLCEKIEELKECLEEVENLKYEIEQLRRQLWK